MGPRHLSHCVSPASSCLWSESFRAHMHIQPRHFSTDLLKSPSYSIYIFLVATPAGSLTTSVSCSFCVSSPGTMLWTKLHFLHILPSYQVISPPTRLFPSQICPLMCPTDSKVSIGHLQLLLLLDGATTP